MQVNHTKAQAEYTRLAELAMSLRQEASSCGGGCFMHARKSVAVTLRSIRLLGVA